MPNCIFDNFMNCIAFFLWKDFLELLNFFYLQYSFIFSIRLLKFVYWKRSLFYWYRSDNYIDLLLGRGRPPKDYSVVENEPIIDSLDSPPKAKRKSRPPRRHKPHYDPRDEAMSHGGGPNEPGPSSGPSSFYEYPGILSFLLFLTFYLVL